MSEPRDEHEEIIEESQAPRPRRRRSPVVDLAVSALGIYLLVTMFGDLRYWLRGSEPRDLGSAAELMEKGLPDDLDEAYVVLRGTPDIQHAARLKIDERVVSYLRVVEGGGALFAAVDRTADQAPNQFEGVFEGRMRRLGKLRMYPWVESFFNAEGITQSREATADALMRALAGGQPLTITDVEGASFRVGADDRIGLVVELPDAQIQLGRSSFRSLAAAEAAVSALGGPYYRPEKQSNGSFYKLFARIGAGERAAIEARLGEGLELPEKPDASYGVAVLPTTANYYLPAGSIDRDGDRLRLVYGDSTTSTGFAVEGDHLVPRPLEDGRLTFEPAAIRKVHLDRPVRVDPEGYLIAVGETPSTQWMAPLMWAGVLLVVGWNMMSLAWWWRRRQA